MKRKGITTLIIFIFLILLSSCNLTPMDDGKGVNDYIFPYVDFALSEDGTYYTATIVEGAALKDVYIPSFDDYFGSDIPVLVFNGFENTDDAKNLESITFESSQTSFSTDLFIYAENLKTFNIENIDDTYAVYFDLATIEKPGFEFDGWYIKGTNIKRVNGDKIIPGYTVLEPKYKEHELKFIERVEATCTSNGHKAYYSCSSCNKLYLDKTALEEVTLSDLIIPASHSLEHFDAKAATCTDSGNIEYYKCTVCSRLFTDSNAVNEITSAVIEPTGHTLFSVVEKAATCTETGVKAHWECEKCHALFTDEKGKETTTLAGLTISALGHDWKRTEYSTENSCTWDECTRCGETDNATGHSWNSGEVTKEATTTEHGTKTFTCTVCRLEKEEDIAPLGEEHTWVVKKTVKNTCTERGYTLKECSTCHIEYKDNYVDANGHDMTYFEVKQPTCLVDGNTSYYKCSVCDSLYKDKNGINSTTEDEIHRGYKALGHEWDTSWTIESDCHYHKCVRCDSYSDYAQHVYNQSVKDVNYVYKDATCTDNAVYYYSCNCGAKGSVTFEVSGSALGHVGEKIEAEVSTCEKQGHKEYYTCERACCSGRYYYDSTFSSYTTDISEFLLPYAHVFNENKYEYDGEYHTSVCDKCGKAIESTKTKHSMTWKHTDYVHWEECTVCGYKRGEEAHTLEGDVGKRLCKKCGFDETKADDSSPGGFDVVVIDKEPSGYLEEKHEGTVFTFTLISTNENAVPSSYVWYVNGEIVEGSTDTYVLSAPDKHSYRVMCVFSSNGRYASSSMTITGGGE